MYIPIILGTARQGRQSEKVARFMLEEVNKSGLESEIIDVRDFKIESIANNGKLPEIESFAKKIFKAEGLIIISPEYNHGYPGELKIILDMIRDEYRAKPVAFCGVSSGGLGGTRGVEQLRLVSIELRMVPIRETLYFPNVQNLFDENGKIKDESYYGRVKVFLDELVWYAGNLKIAREKK